MTASMRMPITLMSANTIFAYILRIGQKQTSTIILHSILHVNVIQRLKHGEQFLQRGRRCASAQPKCNMGMPHTAKKAHATFHVAKLSAKRKAKLDALHHHRRRGKE